MKNYSYKGFIMKRKSVMFGVFVLGILFLTVAMSNSIAIEDDLPGEEEPGEPDPPSEEEPVIPDEDNDGVDDDFEDDNKRDVSIWIGENVVEMGSIRRHGDQKDNYNGPLGVS